MSRQPLSAASDGHSEEAAPPGSPRAAVRHPWRTRGSFLHCAQLCARLRLQPVLRQAQRKHLSPPSPARRLTPEARGRLCPARRLLPPVRGSATRGRGQAGTTRPGHGPGLRDRRDESQWVTPHPPLRGPAARGPSRTLSPSTEASAPGAPGRAHPLDRLCGAAGASRPHARPSAAGRPGSPQSGGRTSLSDARRFRSERAAGGERERPPDRKSRPAARPRAGPAHAPPTPRPAAPCTLHPAPSPRPRG